MPTFYTVDGVKIQLYFDDHVPPHFHATIAEYEALIDIETLDILEGELPKKKRKQIVDWATDHREDLLAIWNELQRRTK